jgi:hypothetical protein
MYEILTRLLSIPNYKVVGIEMTDDTITLDIESTLDGAKCLRWGSRTVAAITCNNDVFDHINCRFWILHWHFLL